MIRQIIHIDEDKCNGCGICVSACHEGAIEMIDGKAKLVRENFCDGFGDCLPGCPTGAITFEEREALSYDEVAVNAAKHMKEKETMPHPCPGSMIKGTVNDGLELQNWPIQIKLAPVQAPYYERGKLLIAADCTAYAYASFHRDFVKGKVTLIGCPKLDAIDYSEKLSGIIANNDIKSVTIVKMEVPCCRGLETATKNALLSSGKFIPWQVVTISIDGKIIE